MKTAFVHIWDELVGAVAWDDTRGLASFEYDEAFKQKGWDLSPVKMPIASGVNIFSFPELQKKANTEFDCFKGLPGMLADTLPDKYGNQLINHWLARHGRPENSMNPVETLCFIGTRGMGALEFEPATLSNTKNTFDVEVNSLVEIAQKILSKREQFNTNLQEQDEQAIRNILKIGTSAGGARPKAVIAYNEKTGQVKSGQAKAPKGFEHWLIKLDGVSDVQLGETSGYGLVEYAYYLMAQECEIKMMPSTLFEENDRAHFMTKRFDREGGYTKHHNQTHCAIKHYDYNDVRSYSYEQLFQTMRELKLTYPEAEQMFRRMVFNVLSRNCDDHTKNFSFRMKKDERWELAPAYDLCHSYRPDSDWVSQHALSINGKRTGISRSDLLTVAESVNIKKAGAIIDQIQSVVNRWPGFAESVSVKPDLRDAISRTLVSL
ncbi:MAG: type II toxin-antitoxin system HipA family toxin [Balneolaceae bacterium]|nr:type II toxin-antitoxin system HipA family toxin [Balneolaceae bacterium]